MNCETFASLLSRLWDGELSPGEEEALRLHAASCPRCAQLLAVWEDARDALAHLDDGVQPPEAFSQGWRDAVRREAFRAKRMRRRPFLRAVAGLAAALVLLVGSTALWREGMLPVAYPDGVRVEASAAPDVQEPGLMLARALPQQDMAEATAGTAQPAQPVEEVETRVPQRAFMEDLARVCGAVLPWALGALAAALVAWAAVRQARRKQIRRKDGSE